MTLVSGWLSSCAAAPGELGDDRLALLREDLLLRLREALLHPHLLAEVGEDADGPDRLVALVEQRRRQRDGRAPPRVEHLGAQALDAPAARADEAHHVLARRPRGRGCARRGRRSRRTGMP